MVALGGPSLGTDHKDAAVALEAAVQASTIQASSGLRALRETCEDSKDSSKDRKAPTLPGPLERFPWPSCI